MKTKIEIILKEIISIIHKEQYSGNRHDIGEDVLFALNYSFDTTIKNNEYSKAAYDLITSVIDRIWERLNIGCWKDVPEYLRSVYAFASFLKAISLLQFTLQDVDENIEKNLKHSLKVLDKGLLLGNSLRTELSQTASSLCALLYSFSKSSNSELDSFYQLKNIQNEVKSASMLKTCVLSSIVCPSIELFHVNYFKKHIPVKLTGCINHWPALQKWYNINYIFEKVGPRLVPVEIGSSYTSSNWSQKLMTIRYFIENFIISSEKKQIGYLAQHQLFNQIPELLDDIREPEYCVLSEDYVNSIGTDMNVWFGPANTVSPLHYDPKHNLLAQIVGSKRVYLIDPLLSKNLYSYDDTLLFNTSQVDLENPDYQKFPKLKNIKIFECHLEPGDMLYIPPKWWHHVRSLSASFSVSFWWN